MRRYDELGITYSPKSEIVFESHLQTKPLIWTQTLTFETSLVKLESELAEPTEKVNIKHPVDPNHIDIQKDPFHPTAYIITLPLDSDPSYIWHTLFEQELWSSLDFWDRKVLVVGRSIKLVTARDRVEEKLRWLQGVVTATNKRVEEYNKKVRAEKDASRSKFMDEEEIRKDVSTWHARQT